MVDNFYPNRNNPFAPNQNARMFGNTLNWVQGIEGAKAFQIGPNSNALMLDSENDGIFYIKTSDNIGMCSMRTFKFEEITNTQTTPQVDLTAYVRKDELQTLLNNILNSEVKHEQTISATQSSVSESKPLITV